MGSYLAIQQCGGSANRMLLVYRAAATGKREESLVQNAERLVDQFAMSEQIPKEIGGTGFSVLTGSV